jgi:thiamine transport system substrate-binding protein
MGVADPQPDLGHASGGNVFSRNLKISACISLAAVALAACSSSQGSQSSGTSESGPTSDTVRLVTYESFAISTETLEAFTRETGLEVEVIKSGDAGAMVNRALLTKENPEADLLFGIDNNLISRANEEDLFVDYRAAGVEELPPDIQRSVDDRATPIDTGDVCLNYDRGYFESRNLAPPTQLADLTRTEYQDLLVVENPSTSTPGLAFMLATVAVFGEEGYLDFWQSLRDNGVRIENSWDTAYYGQFSGGSGGGNRPLVVSYASSPAAEVIFAEEELKESPTAAVLSTCYEQIEFAGVLSGSENEAGAKKFLDFMLTNVYQDDIPLNNFVYPVIADATLPPEFTEFAPKPDEAIRISPDEVAVNRDEWVREWTDLMQR